MSKRRKRNHRARKSHTGNETGDPTTTYDDLPSEESIPIEGVMADYVAVGALHFSEACFETAAESDSRPAHAAAQTAAWLAPIMAKVAWDAALDRNPDHPGVRRAQQAARAGVPLDGAIKVMHATGRIALYAGQQIEPGDAPVLYTAMRNSVISAAESAVTVSADCFGDVTAVWMQGWQPTPGRSSFVKQYGPGGAEMLQAFAQSVHTQTRFALFTAVEQIIRADFDFYDEGDPSEDPRLEMLREALDRSDKEIRNVATPMIVGVKTQETSTNN